VNLIFYRLFYNHYISQITEEAAAELETRMGRRGKEAQEGVLVSAGAEEETVGFQEVLFQVWYIAAIHFMIQWLRERGLDLG